MISFHSSSVQDCGYWLKSVLQQFYLILYKTKVMLSEVVQFNHPFILATWKPVFLHFIINLIKLIFPVCGLNEITVPLFFYHADLRFCHVLVIMLSLKTTWQVWIGWQNFFLLVVVAMSGHLVTITFCILPWILVQMKSENPIFSIRLFVHLYHLCACMFFIQVL